MILAECSSGFAWGDAATWALAVLALFALLANLRLLSQERELFTTLNTAWLDFEGDGKILMRYDERAVISLSLKNFGSVVATNITVNSVESWYRQNDQLIHLAESNVDLSFDSLVPNATKNMQLTALNKKAGDTASKPFDFTAYFKSGDPIWLETTIRVKYNGLLKKEQTLHHSIMYIRIL